MKRNLDKLNRLIRLGIIDIEDFYSISFSEYEILLQGKYVANKTNKYPFTFSIDPNSGYIKGERYNIAITLTD